MKTRTVQLEDVCEVVSKGSTPTSMGFTYSKTGVPFLRAEDIQGGAVDLNAAACRIPLDVNASLTRSQLQPGDLLVTIAGTLGRIGFVPLRSSQVNCNQAVAFARLKPDLVDVRYACYACQSPAVLGPFLDLQKVGTIANLNLEQLRGLRLPLPSLSEQQRIAGQMEQADRLRRTRRYTLELTDTFLPAAFLKIFGDPVLNPKRWPVMCVGDVVERFEGGINFKPVSDNSPASEWRVLKVSAVSTGDFLAAESKPIRPDQAFNDSLIVRRGDLIMSRANTVELVGAACRARGNPPKVLLPDKLWRMRLPNVPKVDPEFLLQCLCMPSIRLAIGVIASGTSGSMKNISKDDAGSIRIPLPPLPLQQQFAALVERVERLRSVQRESPCASRSTSSTRCSSKPSAPEHETPD